MIKFFRRNNFIIIVVCSILGVAQKEGLFYMNGYINIFYIFKIYYSHQGKIDNPVDNYFVTGVN